MNRKERIGLYLVGFSLSCFALVMMPPTSFFHRIAITLLFQASGVLIWHSVNGEKSIF